MRARKDEIMKRFLSLALVAVTALTLMIGALVFGGNGDGASSLVSPAVLSANSNSVIPGDDAPDVTVIKDGESDYVIDRKSVV